MDTTSPEIVFCPKAITEAMEIGDESKPIVWPEPVAFDLSGNVSVSSQTHYSGDSFPAGKTIVLYVFVDGSDNLESCEFAVTLKVGKQKQIIKAALDNFSLIPQFFFQKS